MSSIKEVRPGRGTETFKASSAQGLGPDEQCFSIIYRSGTKTVNVDLAAFSVPVRNAWVDAIKNLMKGRCGLGKINKKNFKS